MGSVKGIRWVLIPENKIKIRGTTVFSQMFNPNLGWVGLALHDSCVAFNVVFVWNSSCSKHHALRRIVRFFYKSSDDCLAAVRFLPGKLQMQALIMMFMEIKSAVDFEFPVMLAWLEVELWLLLYIVWIVTMGSLRRASLNGVSLAIPNAFHSHALMLFTEGRECDFFVCLCEQKANRIFKKGERQKQMNIPMSFMYLQGCYTNVP